MATKKTAKKTVKKAKEAVAVAAPTVAPSVYAAVLSTPRVTEKATFVAQNNVYTFNVTESTNKKEIEKAVFALYKVHPIRVSIVNSPKKSKRNARTGKYGTKGGARKAYVYLKKGDSINLF